MSEMITTYEPDNSLKKGYFSIFGEIYNEQYGLVSQINRAVISVASNLAEGSSRISQKERAK